MCVTTRGTAPSESSLFAEKHMQVPIFDFRICVHRSSLYLGATEVPLVGRLRIPRLCGTQGQVVLFALPFPDG